MTARTRGVEALRTYFGQEGVGQFLRSLFQMTSYCKLDYIIAFLYDQGTVFTDNAKSKATVIIQFPSFIQLFLYYR